MSLKDDLAAIDRALAGVRPRARKPKRPKPTRPPRALPPPLPDESAEVMDILREMPLEDNPRGSHRPRKAHLAVWSAERPGAHYLPGGAQIVEGWYEPACGARTRSGADLTPLATGVTCPRCLRV